MGGWGGGAGVLRNESLHDNHSKEELTFFVVYLLYFSPSDFVFLLPPPPLHLPPQFLS